MLIEMPVHEGRNTAPERIHAEGDLRSWQGGSGLGRSDPSQRLKKYTGQPVVGELAGRLSRSADYPYFAVDNLSSSASVNLFHGDCLDNECDCHGETFIDTYPSSVHCHCCLAS